MVAPASETWRITAGIGTVALGSEIKINELVERTGCKPDKAYLVMAEAGYTNPSRRSQMYTRENPAGEVCRQTECTLRDKCLLYHIWINPANVQFTPEDLQKLQFFLDWDEE